MRRLLESNRPIALVTGQDSGYLAELLLKKTTRCAAQSAIRRR